MNLLQFEGRKGCMKLAVPKHRRYSGRLRLRLMHDGNIVKEAVKEVHFYKADPIHLIETDKAWYTPGQLVRFRLLSLDHLLHPITKKVGSSATRFQRFLEISSESLTFFFNFDFLPTYFKTMKDVGTNFSKTFVNSSNHFSFVFDGPQTLFKVSDSEFIAKSLLHRFIECTSKIRRASPLHSGPTWRRLMDFIN